jgi:hypothetical protein
MYHDTSIGEAMPFPLFTYADDVRVSIPSIPQSGAEPEKVHTSSKEKGPHGGCLTHAICVYRR